MFVSPQSFFFEHGFLGLTRMLRSWRYCLPDSSHYMSWKSRDFVPGYSRFARYLITTKSTIYTKKQPKTDTYFFIFLFIDIFSSVQSAIRVRFTTEFFFEHGFIGLMRMFRSVSEYHHLIKSVISL